MKKKSDTETSFIALMKKKQLNIERKKTIRMKDIGRLGKHYFYCEAFVYLKQSNSSEKYFVFERLKRTKMEGLISNVDLKKNDIEYRISYYILGKIGTKKGTWVFGQYCPMIPPKDFKKLIDTAEKKGVVI